MNRLNRIHISRLILRAWEVMPLVILLLLNSSIAYGSILPQRSMEMSSDVPGTVSRYIVNFSIPSNETLGSIEIQFCSNSPLLQLVCVAPTGMSVANVKLDSQNGTSGFNISALTNSNTIVLSRAPVTEVSGYVSFSFSNALNPSVAGPFYARLQTFATNNASGAATDTGGIALVVLNGYTISTKVLPYLLFCTGVVIANQNCADASGDYINFGDLSPQSTGTAESQLLIATNGQSGYSIQVTGNTMTSGNNVINPLSSDSVSIPGQSQFGLNLVANSSPSIGSNATGPGTGSPDSAYTKQNYFQYSNGSVLASSNQASNYKEYTISYILNIARDQPPGYYATTLTYIGIANF